MNAKLSALQELLEVVAKLRSPDGGCPWDLAQTPETLIPYIIEEAYEVVDAIRSQDTDTIAEELGDLLLQVVLQAQIASDNNQFTITEVAQGISQKLIRRHPHVFTDLQVESLTEIHQNWEQIKAAEKGEYNLNDKLHRYTRTLPPIMATTKIIDKTQIASSYTAKDIEPIWQHFQQSLEHLDLNVGNNDPNQRSQLELELGDLLFDLIALARNHKLDAFAALQTANHRFIDQIY
ncbi:MazG family protein [Synechococcus sp. PCC 7502]|uniref:nucleoside triphosphate pyrophosphohydrolase n=1 Tax=Synechococcus sp. PCC 7502 TaxID=1173263 RepID=UPI00029FE60E|nr:nucleoside triphosphate pyrophosphohydrolase [Synechococcus sp. PCC 7502]AFY72684.1 MazG family protein [Synechococcus sp. PCC 7502]